MRVVALAIIAAIISAITAPSVQAMSVERHFGGGSIICTTQQAVAFGHKHPFGAPPSGVIREVIVVTEAAGQYWYVIDASVKRIPPRDLGAKSKVFTEDFGVFKCAISTEKGVAHTCANAIKGTSGSCVICSEGKDKDRCGRVTFKVTRQKK